jgi:tetratricopeptide (TPR) repeat protein
MGEVWEAEQESLERKVALKVLLPSQRLDEKGIEFFAREARAGGRLSHRGIVGVHASGVDDGVHWISMELVEGGATLADFLDDVRAEDEVPKDYYQQVAELLAKVADGLEAAHAAGVIHRDVKPRNVLITPEDEPKVGDFGLARVVSEHSLSMTGDFAGTYYYMSPEQMMAKRMGIDHRTDVFSLGVVMYELLTLTRPFDGDTTQQIAQKIMTEDPPAIQTLRSRVPEDLSVICGKMLEKSPGRRYPSMAELAADLKRYLAHEPILAKPPTTVQRGMKWLRRNPTKSVAGALTGIALAAISAMAWQLNLEKGKLAETNERLQDQTTLAEHNAKLATDRARDLEVEKGKLAESNERLRDQTALAEYNAEVATERARDLEVANDEIKVMLEEESLQRKENLKALNLMKDLQADSVSRAVQSLSVLRAVLGNEDHTVLFSVFGVGELLRSQNKLEEAKRYFRESLELSRRLDGDDAQTTAFYIASLAEVLIRQAEHAEAEVLLRGAHESGHILPNSAVGIRVMRSLGSVLYIQRKYAEAEPILREVLKNNRFTADEIFSDKLGSVYQLGHVLEALGKYQDAETHYRESLEQARLELGADDGVTFKVGVMLASYLASRDRFDETVAIVHDLLGMMHRNPSVLVEEEGTMKYDFMGLLGGVGIALFKQGQLSGSSSQLAEAETFLRESLAGVRRKLKEDPAQGRDSMEDVLVTGISNMVQVLQFQGKSEEAEPFQREALLIRRRRLGNEDRQTLDSMNLLGVLLQDQDKFDEAGSLFREVLEIARRVYGEEHRFTLTTTHNLGSLLHAQGELTEATEVLSEVLDTRRRVMGEAPDTLTSISSLGHVLKDQGHLDDAELLYREALDICRRNIGDKHPPTLNAIDDLSRLLLEQGSLEEAELLARGLVEITREGSLYLEDRRKLLEDILAVQKESTPPSDEDSDG